MDNTTSSSDRILTLEDIRAGIISRSVIEIWSARYRSIFAILGKGGIFMPRGWDLINAVKGRIGGRIRLMMCIGLRGCVGMGFRGNLSSFSSSIISRKGIKLFTLRILSLILTQGYKRWSLRYHNIGSSLRIQGYVRVWEDYNYHYWRLVIESRKVRILILRTMMK